MELIELSGTHIELTDPIKRYVEDKLVAVAKLCKKFEPCEVQVEVGKTKPNQANGNIYRAEFNLSIPGTKLRAEAIMDDLYAAIDKGTDELRRQVKDYKEKLQDAERVSMDTIILEHEEM